MGNFRISMFLFCHLVLHFLLGPGSTLLYCTARSGSLRPSPARPPRHLHHMAALRRHTARLDWYLNSFLISFARLSCLPGGLGECLDIFLLRPAGDCQLPASYATKPRRRSDILTDRGGGCQQQDHTLSISLRCSLITRKD